MLAITAIRDATGRRKVEARFRALLESTPDALVIKDPRGRIVMVNAQLEKLFGYARDELVGQSIDMLVPERSREAHGGRIRIESEPGRGATFSVELPLEPPPAPGTRPEAGPRAKPGVAP